LTLVSSIGRYEIEREIGRGAMGVVYLAHDPRLQRRVAVKTYTLPDGISEDLAKEFHERFLREARAAASLSHPGIVTIFDAGEDQALGLPYIAMEYVEGQSLKQRLEKGDRLDPSWVLGFGANLAEALHVAHRAGIVHRDIKPANILIREVDGAVKIADFGVARLKASDLTQSGASLGSPGYMSPEQVRGGSLDGRSDLFSLAVVLYEALCGKRPFHGDDLVSLAYSIAHDTQVPLSRQLRDCPLGLDRFFNRALSKDPESRLPDGTAFRDALVDAGRQASPDPQDQTVLDAVTVGSAPAATAALRAGIDERPAASAPGSGRGRRRRFLAVTFASLALLSIGLAGAAYLWLGKPVSLKADNRELPVRHAAAVGADRQAAAQDRSEVTHVDVEPVARPPRIPRNIQVTLPPGTDFRIALDTAVGSAMSRAGDTFTARVTDPVVVGDRVAIPAGSTVHGRVSEAIPAQKGLSDKAGSLSLSFDGVRTPDGLEAPMSAAMSRIGGKSGKKTAGIIGGSAAGGALLGRVLGGSTKKAAVGSIVGGAIGTGIAAGTKGEDVSFAAGSTLIIKLDQPLTISIHP
jgi:tRNA A-37 threonylcarbamoyl transferase component Bud32